MKPRDISGQRFGRLVAIRRTGKDKFGHAIWLFKCDCGNEKEIVGRHAIDENVKSCGCLNSELSADRFRKHGLFYTRAHRIWRAMRERCNPKHKEKYPNYAGKGISVCPEWESFEKFLLDMGHPPEGTSIDRINPRGNYSKENCRWATAKEQQNNRTNNRRIEINGETKTLSQWLEISGVSYTTFSSRVRSGYSVEDALSPKDFRIERHLHASK